MRKRQPDLLILFCVMALLGIGIVMVYSSSAIRSLENYNDSYYFLKRQVIWALIGTVAMLAASKFDYWHYKRLAPLGLIVCFLLLALVVVPGIGRVSHGARRSIGVGGMGVNPSEFAKLAFVIYFATELARRKDKVQKLVTGLGPFLALLGGACLLIMLQPDLGTAVSLAGSCGLMIIAAGARVGQIVLLVLAGVPVLTYFIFSEEYRRRRFLAFIDPWADPGGAGYHIIQALYALGSGGLFGVGLGRGRQKFLYLPEAHTDFIFAITGEELGFIGCTAIIALFFFLAWRGYRVAINAPDATASLLATGVTSMITVQALINIGVVTASLPITGIPLPFISYGGSSLLFLMTSIGILLNVSKYCQE